MAWKGQQSSRLGRSVVTALSSATQTTTGFAAQTYQVRVVATLPIWLTVDGAATVTANSSATYLPSGVPEYFAVTPGQVLNFISTSTSTGYVSITEMS
jgi:hypothetical protein